MNWVKERLNALLDNLIWLGLALLIAVVGGSLLAFGSQQANLPVWAVVLFAVVLGGCVVALVLLLLRVRTLERPAPSSSVAVSMPPPEKPPHPHAALLARIDALRESTETRDSDSPVEWRVALIFNRVLLDARTAHLGAGALLDIDMLPEGHTDEYGGYAESVTYGTLLANLAQIRAVVLYG